MRQVLVTGSAGGIGAATVDAFLGAGFAVIGFDRQLTTRHREGLRSYVVDLADSDAVEEALTDVGSLEHVVAIAGGALEAEKRAADICDVPDETIRASIDQNLITAITTLKATLPRLRQANEGAHPSIALTSSTDALVSYGLAAYAAAKAGIIGLVHALAVPLGRDGIRINALAPGDVPTARNRSEWAHIPDWYEQRRQGTALKRLVTVEEVAASYLALATSLTAVTGQTLVVDSGQVVTIAS